MTVDAPPPTSRNPDQRPASPQPNATASAPERTAREAAGDGGGPGSPRANRAREIGRLGPGLVVALAAAVVTAHGLAEVAVAAHVSEPLAWLYPVITDGLAATAYTATTRLAGSGARYAWTVVVLAAGVSGLAQAVYLAAGGIGATTAALRFVIGAWPAVAAAVVAHLLYLLADPTASHHHRHQGEPGRRCAQACASAADHAADHATATRPGMSTAESGTGTGTDTETESTRPNDTEKRAGPSDDGDGDRDGDQDGDGDRDGDQDGDRDQDDDQDDAPPSLGDGEKRAAAVSDWSAFLSAHPDADRSHNRVQATVVATRYGMSTRWSYYRRTDAEQRLASATSDDAEAPHDGTPHAETPHARRPPDRDSGALPDPSGADQPVSGAEPAADQSVATTREEATGERPPTGIAGRATAAGDAPSRSLEDATAATPAPLATTKRGLPDLRAARAGSRLGLGSGPGPGPMGTDAAGSLTEGES